MKKIISAVLATGFLTTAFAQNEALTIEWNGDFRFRNELTYTKSDDNVRYRQRIKAKFGIEATKDNVWHLGIEMSTNTKDPVSTNMTLSGDFTTEDFGLNQAYVKYDDKLVTFLVGKFNNPLKRVNKTELVWDADLAPEGSIISMSTGDNSKFTATTGAYILRENKKDDETWIQVNQIAYEHKLDAYNYELTVGYTDYHNVLGQVAIAGSPAGNTVSKDEGAYINDYDLLDVGVSFGTKISDLPLNVAMAFARNLELDENNNAIYAGLTVGKAKKPMTLQGTLIYKKLQSDAVLGAFTNSDFNGGGTGGEGFVFNSKLAVNKEVSLALTQFVNSKIDASSSARYITQLDLNYKF